MGLYRSFRRQAILPAFLVLSTCPLRAAQTVDAAEGPPADRRNAHYVSNRAPLSASPLVKLPVGSIEPRGWLRKQLELQAAGFHGHLGEISDFLRRERNSWLSATGEGERGWEEVPYWLKGFSNCAWVLRDERMIAEAKEWLEAALASQQEDGWFGPDRGRTGVATDLTGRDDLWPNMIMLFCLQDYHEASGDERVLGLMRRYFRYLAGVPEERYLLGYWPQMRGGDLLWSIYWLYNRTGEEWLLELAAKNHRRTARWDDDVINWHNVNIAQAFGEGATWWMQSHEEDDLRAAYRNDAKVRALYGQVPGGLFGSDENCRPGFTDPRQAVETCGMVEFMLSCETLVGITADPFWADRCEDVAFNSLPAALTADLKALRYLTAPNQVVSDAANHAPGIQNGGAMFHMNPWSHRCCQHNWGHGWPYYAQHLWYATADDGLAAVFYSASAVKARVGEGREVRVEEETRYPFDGAVRFAVRCAAPVEFPLYLRVPAWCEAPRLRIAGADAPVAAGTRRFIRIRRAWRDGDLVEMELPMTIRLRRWPENHGSVSVDRGPLTYALRIGEDYVRSGGDERWPAWEILPATAWNYGLVLADGDPAGSFEVVPAPWPANDLPWTQRGVPIAMRARGKRIPAWQLDRHGLCATLQQSPVRSEEPVEEISLIPMGAARLRVSAFPVIGEGPDARDWERPPKPQRLYEAAASHCFENDTVEAVADGIAPASSNDHDIARHTFWPHRGTHEWLEARFAAPRAVKAVEVYWFDDTGVGACRVPRAWRLLWQDGDAWQPVAARGVFGVERDRFNRVEFDAVTAPALRIEVELGEDVSAGVLEWKVE